MLRQIVYWTRRWLETTTGACWEKRLPAAEMFVPAAVPGSYRRLQRVLLTDEVQRTLFAGYAAHRQGSRGGEEIGWVMLGVRREDDVLVLATLPAGTARSASNVHVRFDSEAQALGSRVVRQQDKRLTIVGVVHTHPGSLRHPSEGDYQGDSQWVGRLRGGEGVFGIGTADGDSRSDRASSPHMQTEGPLCYSWYAARQGRQPLSPAAGRVHGRARSGRAAACGLARRGKIRSGPGALVSATGRCYSGEYRHTRRSGPGPERQAG